MFIRIGMVALMTLGFIDAPSYGKSRAPQGEAQGSTLSFKLREEFKVLVPVSVNGLEPVSFVLDTGTKTSIVDERICRTLNLQTIARMPLTTFTGTSMVTIVQLESLSMGNASVKGLEVVCTDLKKVYSLDSEIYGVLGQNFLVRFNYLLDYRERKIVLDEDGNVRKNLVGAEFPIEVDGCRDYVLYDAGWPAQQPVRFMLDSGSRFPVIFENPQVNSALRIERETATAYTPGSIAGRDVDTGRIRSFRIGSETINNLSVRLTRARDIERRKENGLLPTGLFRAIYFNHENGSVILNPRMNSR
jgi:hypothetical protein